MKYGPSMQDYIKTAKTLLDIRNGLIDADIQVTNTFGKKYNLSKTHEIIDKMRSSLENKMFEDFPNDASTQIFYPHKEG